MRVLSNYDDCLAPIKFIRILCYIYHNIYHMIVRWEWIGLQIYINSIIHLKLTDVWEQSFIINWPNFIGILKNSSHPQNIPW